MRGPQDRIQRVYGIETIERFVRKAAVVEFVGPPDERAVRALVYNNVAADRQVIVHSPGTGSIFGH